MSPLNVHYKLSPALPWRSTTSWTALPSHTSHYAFDHATCCTGAWPPSSTRSAAPTSTSSHPQSPTPRLVYGPQEPQALRLCQDQVHAHHAHAGGDRRRALRELPLPEAGLKGREEVVCLQYVDLSIQLETGHKVAICPRRKLLYMWIYVIRDQKLLLRGIFLSINLDNKKQARQNRKISQYYSYKAWIERERLDWA